MKKDFANVFITFSLITSTVLVGSFYYGKKVAAQLANEKIAEEQRAHEQELLAMQVEERARQTKKLEDERIAKEEELAKEKIRIAQAKDQSAKAQAEAQKQVQAAYQTDLKARQEEANRINAEVIALVQQQEDAKNQAQKLADQKAADVQVKKKASRKSRAS